MEIRLHVSKWLEELQIDAADTNEFQSSPPDDHARQSRPVTPNKANKANNTIILSEEISPTTTNFSHDSVFDRPFTATEYHSHKLGLVLPQQNDAISQGSITDLEDYTSTSCLHEAITNSGVSFGTSFQSDVDPLTDAPTIRSIEVKVEDAKAGRHDFYNDGSDAEKRLVIVVSCLQCTMKGLRCSRTLPACTRCLRANAGDLCLLHRRKMPFEPESPSPVDATAPVLIRLKDDSDKRWNEKLRLAQELLQAWQSRQDRSNWVLPNPYLSGPPRSRRTYRTSNAGLIHPGEGQGNVGAGVLGRWLELSRH